MNALVVTEAFPPAPVVGSFRAYKVARALRDRGFDVHVLTTRGGSAGGIRRGEYERGITWERVTPWPGPRQVYLSVRTRFRRSRPGQANAADGTGPPAPNGGATGGIRGIVAGLLTMPDDQQGLVPVVARAAYQRRGQVDIIYSTAPCFSALIAGRTAQKILGVPWFAELRDPWIGNAARVRQAQTPVVGRLDRWLERWCLTNADGVVLVTPRAAEEYRRRFEGHRMEIIYALNGIDSVAPLERTRPAGPLRIVYAGSVYPPRDPAPLIRALGAAYGPGCSAPDAVLTFVGAEGWSEVPELGGALDQLPACVQVEHLPWLPQVEARRLIDSADLLLLPAQRWLLQIPNKLYDYLGSRVPVLGIVERDSDTEYMLRTSGDHYLAYPDSVPADLERLTASALAAAAQGTRVGDEAVLASWTTTAQMAGLVGRITELASGSRPTVYPQAITL
jgi:glycosyltransferase involved in cell wall biosynthesis